MAKRFLNDRAGREFNGGDRRIFKKTLPCFPDKRNILLSGLATFAGCLILILCVDRSLALVMRSMNPSIREFFKFVTIFGKSTAYLILSGLLFIFLYLASKSVKWANYSQLLRKYAWISLFLFASIAVSGLLIDILKVIFARYRPVMLYEAGKYGFTFFKFSPARVLSFPSGHANTIFALMTALCLIVPRYRFIFLAIAILVAANRVIIGAHFLSDVIAGAYLGVITPLYFKAFFLSRGIDIFSKKGPVKSVQNK